LRTGFFAVLLAYLQTSTRHALKLNEKNEYLQTYVEKSVTIGANATIVCGVKLGAFSFIGAGAVVTKDVVPHALVVGTPARQIGWVSHSGERLDKNFVCPREGRQYQVIDNQLVEMKEIRSKNHAA
jgi:UDP-2-acetamido-3-amino-2,3-dideoxy-glucuronate N-acetyltransferase